VAVAEREYVCEGVGVGVVDPASLSCYEILGVIPLKDGEIYKDPYQLKGYVSDRALCICLENRRLLHLIEPSRMSVFVKTKAQFKALIELEKLFFGTSKFADMEIQLQKAKKFLKTLPLRLCLQYKYEMNLSEPFEGMTDILAKKYSISYLYNSANQETLKDPQLVELFNGTLSEESLNVLGQFGSNCRAFRGESKDWADGMYQFKNYVDGLKTTNSVEALRIQMLDLDVMFNAAKGGGDSHTYSGVGDYYMPYGGKSTLMGLMSFLTNTLREGPCVNDEFGPSVAAVFSGIHLVD
jgi:hypothetical protein